MPRISRSSSTTWPCRATRPRRINGVGFLPPFPEGLGLARNTKNFEVESLAVFADATWHVTDSLDLIAGARYTQDDVLNERTSFGIAPSCNCGPPDPAFFPSFINFDAAAGERRHVLRRRLTASRNPLRVERLGQRVRDDLQGLQGRWHEHRQQHQRPGIPGVQRRIRRGDALELRGRHKDRARRQACATERIGLLHGLGGPAGRGVSLPDARPTCPRTSSRRSTSMPKGRARRSSCSRR